VAFQPPDLFSSRREIIPWREDENPLDSLSVVRAEVLEVAGE